MDKAREVLQRLVQHVDVVVANEEHAREILEVPIDKKAQAFDRFDGRRYEGQSRALLDRYGLSHVAITARAGELAHETSVSAFLDDSNNHHMARRYDIQVVDRIGGGDAFTGGLIYALLEGWKVERAVEFAVAAGCMKHSVPADLGHLSLAEVLAVMRDPNAGRVER
jgi:2-dehydro-3-deoxygluconokinase